MSLIEIVNSLFSIAPNLLSMREGQRENRDNALRAIAVALDETYLYYRDIERGNPRNEDREELLVRYWSAAAIPMRHFDQSLAMRCDMKAEYWLDPTRYSNKDIKKLEIGLESVRNAYRTLLQPDMPTVKATTKRQMGVRRSPSNDMV